MEQQLAQYGKLLLSYLPRFDALCMLALLLCLTALPVLAVFGQSLAGSSGRSAYDKCARQLGHLGSLLGLVATCVGGIALAVQYWSLPAPDMKNFAARENFLPLLAAGGWLCVVIATLLNCLYTSLWQSRRATSGGHHFLGFSAALAAAAAVYAFLLYLHSRAAAPVPASADMLALFLPGTEEVFWTGIICAPFAALALAGGYGALWLLLRRVIDDYGRDHYNLVVPWCAGWARNGWLLLWLFLVCRAGRRIFLHEAAGGVWDWMIFLPDGIGLLVLLPPGLWWMGISRSTAPLRDKVSAFIAPVWATGCLALLDMGLR